ncbi:YIP1 family protein [Cognatiyoonia sp. IB215446]|uniref:YIP1 family protein n=1 Tax=Cognatiyoonia sp. IB215446 TaxID=3097355 RepID=UPI002A150F01|nr:YIP1 family protein [Cognatiyoonia sp. IB215446]MDX8349797.1 YIP1 family protein [Cognatiyoonia sp. IB215446]
MTISFQTWMQTVWISVTQPAEMAGKVLSMQFSRDVLWTALALVAVLNVLLLGVLQLISPMSADAPEQVITVSPFGYLAIIGAFLTFMIFMLVHAGRMMGGDGTIEGTLTLLVWFQAVSLTLEAMQVLLVLLSPAIAALFGLMSLGAIIWVFVNLVNVLHSFANLGKAIVVIFMALIGTVLGTGLVMGMLGITPPGAF